MTAEVEQTASQIITGWNDRLVGLADALTEAAKAHGPEVADAVLAVARVEAIGNLVMGGALLLATFGCYRIIRHTVSFCSSVDWDNAPAPALIIRVICSVIAGFAIIPMFVEGLFFRVADIWNWVGVIEPKLWLAHKLLNL